MIAETVAAQPPLTSAETEQLARFGKHMDQAARDGYRPMYASPDGIVLNRREDR